MDANHIQKIIQGSDSVVRWFGVWPDFHDAEILYLNLTRSGESALRVFPDSSQKPAFVDFFLEEVTDLELADFSSQNVIYCLDIQTVTDQTNTEAVRLTLAPCYGLAGRIDAKRIRKLFPENPRSDALAILLCLANRIALCYASCNGRADPHFAF